MAITREKNNKKELTKERTKYILTVLVDMIQLVQTIQFSEEVIQ